MMRKGSKITEKHTKLPQYTKKYTRQELETNINEYFDLCLKNKETPLVIGLANHLGIFKTSMTRWRQKTDYRGDLIKAAYDKIEALNTKFMLYDTKIPSTAIFYMKNAHKWADRLENDQKVSTDVTLNIKKALSKISDAEATEMNTFFDKIDDK
jgi:uncharacterized membrane protein